MSLRRLALGATFASAAVLGWSTVALASGNLVSNPGFETGDITGWTQVGNYSTGYNGAAPSNFTGMTPYAGNYFFEFGNYTTQGTAGISQTISTVAGQSYDLSYAWSTGGADSASNQAYEVLWNGAVVASYSTTGSSSPWTLASLTVTGTGTDTLTIEGLRNYGYNGIDNISIAAAGIPEPATWALMFVGFGGLAAGLRARRSKAATAI